VNKYKYKQVTVKSPKVAAQTQSTGSVSIDNTNNKITSRPTASVQSNKNLNQDTKFIYGVKIQVQRNSEQR